MITQEKLKELFYYNSENGVFIELRNGKVKETIHSRGHINIDIKGRVYMAHRLAWLYVYGRFPEKGIDHINRKRSDNRIINLREADQSQNLANSVSKQGTSKYKGVQWNRRLNKWVARIKVRGKVYYLGLYLGENDAAKAYNDAATKHFGEFANLNEIPGT